MIKSLRKTQTAVLLVSILGRFGLFDSKTRHHSLTYQDIYIAFVSQDRGGRTSWQLLIASIGVPIRLLCLICLSSDQVFPQSFGASVAGLWRLTGSIALANDPFFIPYCKSNYYLAHV